MQYVIQPGDTLSGISEKFNVPQIEIARANGILNPDRIFAGHVLIIPTKLVPDLNDALTKFLNFIGIRRIP